MINLSGRSTNAKNLCHRLATQRHGSIYILVLGLATLAAVVGFGTIGIARLATRSAADGRDWSEAGVLAMSGVELATSRIAQDSQWRTSMKSGQAPTALSLGRGLSSFTVVDEIDGDLSNNSTDPVRVYGTGRVGRATRCYSVQLAPSGGQTPTSLSCPLYATGNISIVNTATGDGGPVSCAGTLTSSLLSTLSANVDAGAVVKLGTINGTVLTGAPAKTMPAASVFDTYAALATSIPFGSIPSGTINNCLLSPGDQPAWATANAMGVYAISVPALSTLTIQRSRLVATLVVTLGAGRLTVTNTVLWDPGQPSQPSLIVKATGSATIDLTGSASALSDATNTNLNPQTTPYLGAWNATKGDSYPSELHGVFHIIGASTTTNVGTAVNIIGAVITEGSVAVSGGATLTVNGSWATSPPTG